MITWEHPTENIWRARIGQVLRLRVEARVVGTEIRYIAEVEDSTGNFIERQDGINFGRIAQDIAIAMAHRILHEALREIEGER